MSEEIKIEKGVPMPSSRGSRLANGLANVLSAMAVGDSFTYPMAKRGNVLPMANRLGIKITTRTEGDILRVWRIA